MEPQYKACHKPLLQPRSPLVDQVLLSEELSPLCGVKAGSRGVGISSKTF